MVDDDEKWFYEITVDHKCSRLSGKMKRKIAFKPNLDIIIESNWYSIHVFAEYHGQLTFSKSLKENPWVLKVKISYLLSVMATLLSLMFWTCYFFYLKRNEITKISHVSNAFLQKPIPL